MIFTIPHPPPRTHTHIPPMAHFLVVCECGCVFGGACCCSARKWSFFCLLQVTVLALHHPAALTSHCPPPPPLPPGPLGFFAA